MGKKVKEPKEAPETVNLDEKLASQGTYAVGVQAMMRNRIQGK